MTFRFARHTHDLERIAKFYTEVLGFELLGEFSDHDTYDGIFLGPKNADWHLEVTSFAAPAGHTFDEDDLLVFYPSTSREYQQLIHRMETHNIKG